MLGRANLAGVNVSGPTLESTAPLSLRQIVALLQGCLEAGADPEKPVVLFTGGRYSLVTEISVTTDDHYDECDVWIGGDE